MIRPRGHRSRLDHLLARIEVLLYKGGWPFRVARAVGVRPEVTITRYDIPIIIGTGSLPPLRVGFASDFHAGPTTDPALLHAACDSLRLAAPDVLLLGGDFVSVVSSEIDWLARELGRIPAPFGRFAVMGNHDWCSDTPYIIRSLEREGIQVLINRNVRLAEPFGQVWICGLDDHGYGEPNAVGAMANAAGVRILLMHAPSGLLDVGQERFDLALCGHTHGGQIALPGGVPIVTPHGPLSRQYARGRFDLPDDRTLVVSVGLGSVVFPLRLFAKPEVVLCNVRVG